MASRSCPERGAGDNLPMLRFLHTGDWQLGITREYLGDEAQSRWAQARFDAIRTIGRIATDSCFALFGASGAAGGVGASEPRRP